MLPQVKQTQPIIKLCNVSKNYKNEAGSFPALKNVSLDVYPGEFLGIIGRSGAGKSTLLNMITGVDCLTSGEVWVCDVNIQELQENKRSRWRGRHMGVIYQTFQLLPMLSLIDNVMMPMDFCGDYHPYLSVKRSIEILSLMGIEAHANKLPTQISGGQQQRVAIARALANDPDILVADEPTGNLDSVTAETVIQVFLTLVKRGKTIIMVTHDTGMLPYFSRTAQISDGELTVDQYQHIEKGLE